MTPVQITLEKCYFKKITEDNKGIEGAQKEMLKVVNKFIRLQFHLLLKFNFPNWFCVCNAILNNFPLFFPKKELPMQL